MSTGDKLIRGFLALAAVGLLAYLLAPNYVVFVRVIDFAGAVHGEEAYFYTTLGVSGWSGPRIMGYYEDVVAGGIQPSDIRYDLITYHFKTGAISRHTYRNVSGGDVMPSHGKLIIADLNGHYQLTPDSLIPLTDAESRDFERDRTRGFKPGGDWKQLYGADLQDALSPPTIEIGGQTYTFGWSYAPKNTFREAYTYTLNGPGIRPSNQLICSFTEDADEVSAETYRRQYDYQPASVGGKNEIDGTDLGYNIDPGHLAVPRVKAR
jgi:hypothetical protein